MTKPGQVDMNQMARAWSMGMDMFVNLLAGGILGFGLDWLFGTYPILMLVFGLLGLAFGMLKFIREALRLNREVTGTTKTRTETKESDE
jgi:ATP synthase protein I